MADLIPYLLLVGMVLVILWLLGMGSRLQRIDRKLTVLMRYMKVDVSQVVGLSDRVKDLARSGDKIAAIKQHREETGLGLKEAKDAVEEFLDAGQ